ncbi:hypothetical protein SFR_3789 [Streptomyces sp. FR-008]|nr:hypothetical protein SFR_3789 [Streptomyces sp. FR-008]
MARRRAEPLTAAAVTFTGDRAAVTSQWKEGRRR